ncbi:ATP-binding protein [Aliishimia ponticola]|nr:ATP-binding protein [Aliishimia ponticola]
MSTEASPVIVKMKFRSGPLAVRAALAHIVSELQPMNWSKEDLGTVEIVLAEALNNIVEHAYTGEDVAGPIAIDCRAQTSALHVRIIDDGHPMPDEQPPELTEANLDMDLLDLPEGGFGWYLIRKLANDVEYRRENNQNVLDLHLALAASA